MRVKDAAFLGSHRLADLLLHLQNLLAGLNEGFLETIDFFSHSRFRNRLFPDSRTGAIQHKSLAPANPGGNRDAAKKFFSLRQCLWHGYFLSKATMLEKEFLGFYTEIERDEKPKHEWTHWFVIRGQLDCRSGQIDRCLSPTGTIGQHPRTITRHWRRSLQCAGGPR